MIIEKPAYTIMLCASILVLSSWLSIDRGEVAVGIHAKTIHIPWVCLFKSLTGQDCPLCGMTRSLISVGHLDIENGWRYNRAGVIVYVFIVYQLIASLCLVLKRRGDGSRKMLRPMTTDAYYTLSALLLVAWIYRIMGP